MLIQQPGEPSSSFQSRVREKLRLLGHVSTAVLVAASSSHDGSVTFSPEGPRGEPLRGYTRLAA
ncbi:hypothetical protein [Sorangium cellulosum]|uniref:hypothetical protein n=1 Tax=Sorangium cellulosum TaxID=56 RepID=UPI0013311A31|nr:hypothetical protein [Sorangium cellulosum]